MSTSTVIDEPLDVWVVTHPEGHLGIFATEELAIEHKARFGDNSDIEIERDELRFGPMIEIGALALHQLARKDHEL